MIKFVNLDNGAIYDGLSPYIHHPFGSNGLSINLPAIGKICFVSKNPIANINIADNPVYSLLDVSKFESSEDTEIYNFKYKDLNNLKNNSQTIEGYKYTDDLYVYIIYILANASEVGEWRDNITIDDVNIEITGDFYTDDERLWINASNFGFESPDAIQKAIYCNNLHEDQKDSVLLNRKLKELLSNYWDILANRGSYNSLINSLKWFEYGDKVEIKELWKHEDYGRITYEIHDLKSLMEKNYRELLFATAKTTYIALYFAKQKIDSANYDSEKNPILNQISTQWSWEDLSLKMTLLGNFYETYFMPIHLDLIHSTLEDIVFTNTIKMIQSSALENENVIINTNTFDCNVIDNQLFTIGDISCQAGPRTIFGTKWNGQSWGEQDEAIGVDEIAEGQINDFQSFWINKIGGTGCIVHFECTLPELFENEVIKRESIVLESEKTGSWIQRESRIIINSNFIEFNILFRNEGIKDLRIQFESSLGRLFTKRISIEIRDVNNMAISIYKMVGEMPENFDLNTKVATDYFFSRSYIEQDIWKSLKMHISSEALSLNKTYVIEVNNSTDYQNFIDSNADKYFISIKNTDNDKTYLILISKTFGEMPEIEIPKEFKIIRSDTSFIPYFQKLIPFEGNTSIDEYTISDKDVLWFIPEFLYGKEIENSEWSFNNVTKNPHKIDYNLPTIRGIFAVASETEATLEKGFYDVIFRFKLISESKEHIIKLKSAFRKI